MIALRIPDIKDFMNKLLLGTDFDQFCLMEASITTFNQFSIDGRIHPAYFDTDSEKLLKESRLLYTPWKEVKAWCYSVIRGKRTPLSFRILFQLPYQQTAAFSKKLKAPQDESGIQSLMINIQYRNQELLLTNGISLQTFSLDKSPEHLWDSMVQDFLKQHQILFENLTSP